MEKEMEKEQRRRKIIARGTDRMALITGRINTLDPDPISKCSSFSVNRPDLPPPQHSRSSSEPLSANDQVFFQYGACESPNITSKHDHVEEHSRRNDIPINRGGDVAPELQKHHDNKEVVTSQRISQQQQQQQQFNLLGPFTAQAINMSLKSSEDIRAICSAALAVAVVVTHIILHFTTVVRPDTLVAFRPLFVVVLTDFLIVAVRLLPYAVAVKRKEEESKYEDDGDPMDGAVKMLELGLVLHQAISAIFIDCSFYLVVVILGLSLV